MSDKTWYEHLDEEDLDGKHVQVTLADGTVLSGRLTVRDDYPDVALLSTALVLPYEDGTKADWPIGVMCQTEDPRWLPFEGVTDISLVWDERDWEELGPDDYGRADAIVVNGRLIRVNGLAAHHQFRPVAGFSVSFEHVSCALRRRHRLPTEPGAYRGADGTLLMLTDISLPDKWMYVSEDFKECGVFLGDEQAEEHLPLTPVHFVDGRAE